ncbi:Xaa-Pro peptidase family protein [uncultured Eubacterium sp.]|uniref:M24 family metallopeptidase n=1 Tax=uncultured Eubacterium sp. TaxID=165185 RepID=UPI0028051D61|nr:Xaa-Pro peptidase family protein [uncultured Eubacterium sp.]
MMNIQKCVKILEHKNADALVLLNESNMHYLCGFSPSEGMIVVLKNGDAFHLVDSRYTETAENHAKETGLKVIEFKASYYEELAKIINDSKSKSIVYESNTISLKAFENIKKHCKDAQMVELGDLLMRERNRKEAEEIVLMKKANQIAEKAFLELLNHIKPGKTEKELAAYFDYLMAKEGSDGVSFDTILLAGEKTSMPHGVPSENTIKSGELVLFDFGAIYQGYHSDMTRTVAVGSASDEMKEMYELVLNAQLAGIKALNAGVKCADVYKAAYDVLNEKNMAQYFRHGLGHGLGIEIHEGFNASPRSKDTYEVGNVTSIEPGIYIPGKFGIRIEDVCYLAPRGRENLSNVTKSLIIL